MFHFGLQENVFAILDKPKNKLVWRRQRKASFEDLNKDMFLKSKMKHVVKYDVYFGYIVYGVHLDDNISIFQENLQI